EPRQRRDWFSSRSSVERAGLLEAITVLTIAEDRQLDRHLVRLEALAAEGLYTRRECSRALGVERRDAAHDVEKHLLIVGLLCHVETMIQIAGMPPVGGLAAAAANGIANPTIMFGEVASNPLAGACNDEVARITHWLAARPARVQSSPSC